MQTYLKKIELTLGLPNGTGLHLEICHDHQSLSGQQTDTHRAFLPGSELSPTAEAALQTLFEECIELAPELMPVHNGEKLTIQMKNFQSTKTREAQKLQAQLPEPMGA